MGSPKQLLDYQGENLVNSTIKKAVSSVCDPVILILGANAEIIHNQISESEIKILENQNWQLGMSTSICCGMTEIMTNYPDLEAVIITVCDQPFLSTEIINNLVDSFNIHQKPIIACEYADTLGVPVFFHQKYFHKLAHLTEDMGARKLIKMYKSDVFSIPFPLGAIDIDTPQDYQQLLSQ
ncbi:MAG: nucleotidyltransferase family protein [Sphaerospermopsis sp. SIO1G2]|nr:nucleotidyltransferase family protein [Sphaerospermopsis sp. SIO1G2]